MKRAFIFSVLITALVIPATAFALSEHIEYNISINNDGSASWHIIHVTDIDSPFTNWEEFEQKLDTVISTAKNATARPMALDLASLEMKTEIQWETSSRTTEFTFIWQNFSILKESQIVFGDVFAENLFTDLYADGELYITYPQEYRVSTASPLPNDQNNASKTLHWYRTQDFTTNPIVELILHSEGSNQENTSLGTIAILSSAGIGAAVVGVLILSQKRKRKNNSTQTSEPKEWQRIVDSKEEILQLLKTSGGSLRQSEICTKLKYSRAKTSILLTEMEKNNQIRRDKKGKNKTVYIMK